MMKGSTNEGMKLPNKLRRVLLNMMNQELTLMDKYREDFKKFNFASRVQID